MSDLDPSLLAYLADKHLGLIVLAVVVIAAIMTGLGRRQTARLQRQNDKLLALLERATGLEADKL